MDVFQLRRGTAGEEQSDCRSRQVTMPNRVQDSLGSSRSAAAASSIGVPTNGSSGLDVISSWWNAVTNTVLSQDGSLASERSRTMLCGALLDSHHEMARIVMCLCNDSCSGTDILDMTRGAVRQNWWRRMVLFQEVPRRAHPESGATFDCYVQGRTELNEYLTRKRLSAITATRP